jgi:chitin synthase
VAFIAIFGVILMIQFIAMFFHRFETLEHMLATTKINWFEGAAQVGTVNSSPQRQHLGMYS